MKKLFAFVFTIFIIILLNCFSLYSQSNTIHVKDKFGNDLDVELNKNTGTAHHVFKLRLNVCNYGLQQASLDRNSIEQLSAKFFDDYRDILRIKNADLKIKKIDTDKKNWFVLYNQYYNNILVFGAEAGYTINKKGEIVTLGADVFPDLTISTQTVVTESEAMQKAKDLFNAKEASISTSNGLIIYPNIGKGKNEYYLAWKIIVSSNSTYKSKEYFINAIDGSLIVERDAFIEYTEKKEYAFKNVNTDKFNEKYEDILPLTQSANKNIFLYSSVSGTITGYYKNGYNTSYISFYPQTNGIRTLSSNYSQIDITNSDNNGYYSLNANGA